MTKENAQQLLKAANEMLDALSEEYMGGGPSSLAEPWHTLNRIVEEIENEDPQTN